MGIYIFNFIFNGVLSFQKKYKNLILFFGFVLMFSIFAFRSDSLGVDLENYKTYYRFYSNFELNDILRCFKINNLCDSNFDVEFGYILWGWIISKIGLSFHGFLVVNSFIFCLVLFRFFAKDSKNPYLSLIIVMGFGIYEYNFCILRQSLATCLLLISLKYVKNNSIFKFSLLVILAIFFHRTSVFFLPIYFLYKMKMSKKFYIVFFIFNIILLFSIPTLYVLFYDRIMVVIGKNSYEVEDFSLNFIILTMFFLFIILILFKKEKNNAFFYDNKVHICMFLIGMLLEVFACVNGIFGRIAIMSYLLSISIIIPNMLDFFVKSSKFKCKELVSFSMQFFLILFMFFLFYKSLSDSSMQIVPYKTILNREMSFICY